MTYVQEQINALVTEIERAKQQYADLEQRVQGQSLRLSHLEKLVRRHEV